MKYKIKVMVSAFGKVFEEGKVYPGEEVPEEFVDAWVASGYVEAVEE